MVKGQKMSFKWNESPWNIDFSTSLKSNFVLVKRNKMCSQCLSTTWNIAFSNWTSSILVWYKRQKMSSNCHGRTRNIAYLFHTSRNFGWTRGRKWVENTIWPLEASFFDFTLVAFWTGPETENELKVPCEPLKHRFSKSPKLHFGLFKRLKLSSQCLEKVWNIALSVSLKSRFGLAKRKKVISKCHGRTWNIVF